MTVRAGLIVLKTSYETRAQLEVTLGDHEDREALLELRRAIQNPAADPEVWVRLRRQDGLARQPRSNQRVDLGRRSAPAVDSQKCGVETQPEVPVCGAI